MIINEADLLTRDAQSALRRTMEKFTGNLRVILCANSTSKVIGPIRSRCLLLRVGVPSEEEVSLFYATTRARRISQFVWSGAHTQSRSVKSSHTYQKKNLSMSRRTSALSSPAYPKATSVTHSSPSKLSTLKTQVSRPFLPTTRSSLVVNSV